MSHLDAPVLKVAANWSTPLEVISVRNAFEDASAGAVDLFRVHEGYPQLLSLEEWMKIEPQEGEDYISTSRMHGIKRILVPRACIIHGPYRPKAKEQKCTPDALMRRYKGKDAVTGLPLPRHRFSREHVDPRSKGGRNGWHNEVPMDRDLNSRRGNKPYSEVGLPEPKILGEPPPLLPINSIRNTHNFEEWRMLGIPDP